MSFGGAAGQPKCEWRNDVALPDGPNDSVSALAWSTANNHLAVSAWDNSVRIYEVAQKPSMGVQGKAMFQHSAPVLDVCWKMDGSKVFSAGVDNLAKCYDLQTGQATDVAQHGQPVKAVRWTDLHNGLLVTASWDKLLKVGLGWAAASIESVLITLF